MHDGVQSALEALRDALFRPGARAFLVICDVLNRAAGPYPSDTLEVLLPYAEQNLAAWPDDLRTLDSQTVAAMLGGPMPQLLGLARHLDLRTTWGSSYGQLGRCEALASIRHLSLWRSAPDEIGPLLESPHLGALESITLLDLPWGRDIPRLAALPIFGRLRSLSVKSSASDAGAFVEAVLAQRPPLDTLGISYGTLDPARLERLLALLPPGQLHHLSLVRASLPASTGEQLARSPAMTGLRTLDLEGNPLGDAGVGAIGRAPFWPLLESLDLADCRLGQAGAEAAFATPPLALRSLRIDKADLGIDGLQGLLRRLTHGRLEHLGLRECAGFVAPCLGDLPPRLSSLDLARTRLGDDGAQALATVPFERLTRLDVSGNRLTSEGVAALLASPHLCHLEDLAFGWNEVGDTLADALRDAPLDALRKLSMQHTLVADAVAIAIATNPHLEALDELSASSSAIGDLGAAALASAPHLAGLTTLALDHCPIGSAGMTALLEAPWFPSLELLDLESCLVGDDGVLALSARPGGLPHALQLGDNPISTHIAALLNVEVLDDARLLALFDWAHGMERRLGLVALLYAVEHPEQQTALFELLTLWPDDSPRLTERLLPLIAEQVERVATFPLPDSPPASWVDLLDRPGQHALAPLGAFAVLTAPPGRLGPAEVARLAASPALRSVRILDLSDNPIGAEGLRALATSPHLTNLEVLALQRCGLDDAALKPLTRALELTRLSVLDLSGNAITETGARAIARAWWLPVMKNLAVNANPLGPAGALHLIRAKDAKALETLALGCCGVTLEDVADHLPATLSVGIGPPWRVKLASRPPSETTGRQTDAAWHALQTALDATPSPDVWLAIVSAIHHLHQSQVVPMAAWLPAVETRLATWPDALRQTPWDCVELIVEGRALPWFRIFKELEVKRLGDAQAWLRIATSDALWHLRRLSLHAIPLGDLALKRLLRHGGLRGLEALRLHNCELTDASLAAIAQNPGLAGLEQLVLSWNAMLSAQGVRWLTEGEGMGQLRILVFQESPLGDTGATTLATARTLQHLQTLAVGRCGITDRGAASLLDPTQLPALRTLSLSSNPVTNATAHRIVEAAEHHPWDAIDVSNTEIDDEGRALLEAAATDGRIGDLFV